MKLAELLISASERIVEYRLHDLVFEMTPVQVVAHKITDEWRWSIQYESPFVISISTFFHF